MKKDKAYEIIDKNVKVSSINNEIDIESISI